MSSGEAAVMSSIQDDGAVSTKELSIEYNLSPQAQEVIDFWFAGNQTVNYKTKWFPEGSSAHQAAIDLEIYTRFGQLLEDAISGKLSHWKASLLGNVALIVVLDQFSRHVFRHLELPAGHERRLAADELALGISVDLHECQFHSILSLSMAQYVFSLMPLRHSPNIDRLQYVLSRLEDKEGFQSKAVELLERFRKQTVRRLQHLQDRAKLEQTDDILERQAFAADESDILSHPLVRTTEAFLKKHLLKEKTNDFVSNSLKKRNEKGTFQKQAREGSTNGQLGIEQEEIVQNVLLISLSGGVDSMVLSKILALLQRNGRIPISRVVAMHIDYANRPESGREAEYVEQWSKSLEIECCVRTINEATRGVTERDAYEKITRNIRYGFYQTCREKALTGGFTASGVVSDKINVSGVIFGHHLGDVQENVISNVMRGSSPLDLSGMTESSITNGVLVWRPLLAHVKQDIYDFAHKYGVPYFKDSTPSWSTRGKLRNQLVPLLVEIYGEGCLRNLSNLAAESDQNLALVHQNLYAPFLRSMQKYPCGLIVNVLSFRQQPQCFWREVLKLLMHSMGMSMVREKAVANFVERLHRPATTDSHILPGWLELRKGFHTFLSDNGELLILRDGTLRSTLVVYNPATTRNQALQKKSTTSSSSTLPNQQNDELDLPEQALSGRWQFTWSSAVSSFPCIAVTVAVDSPTHVSRPVVFHQDLLLEELATDFDQEDERQALQDGEIALGVWAVRIDVVSWSSVSSVASTLQHKDKVYRSVQDIISGTFSYSVSWPHAQSSCENEIPFVLLQDAVKEIEQRTNGNFSILQNNVFAEESSPLSPSLRLLSFDIRAMDLRLRDGLPLLVPVYVDPRLEDEKVAQPTKFVNLQLNYRFIGPCGHADHH